MLGGVNQVKIHSLSVLVRKNKGHRSGVVSHLLEQPAIQRCDCFAKAFNKEIPLSSYNTFSGWLSQVE